MRKKGLLLGACLLLTACSAKKEAVPGDESIKAYLQQHNAPLNYEVSSEIVNEGFTTALVDTYLSSGIPYASYTIRYNDNGLVEESKPEMRPEEEIIEEYLHWNSLSDLFVVTDRFDYTDGTHGISIEVDGESYNVSYDDRGELVPEPKADVQCHIDLEPDVKETLRAALTRYLEERHILIPAEITSYDFECVVIQMMERPVALKISTEGDDDFTLKMTEKEYIELVEEWAKEHVDGFQMISDTCVRDSFVKMSWFNDLPTVFVTKKGDVFVTENSIGWQVETTMEDLLKEALLAWSAFNEIEGEITVIAVEDGYVDIAVDSQERRLKLAIGYPDSYWEPTVLYMKNLVIWDCDYDAVAEARLYEVLYNEQYTGEVRVLSTEPDEDGVWYKVALGNEDICGLLVGNWNGWDPEKY